MPRPMVQNLFRRSLSHRAQREHRETGEEKDFQSLANHERKDILSFRL
jgi:hypothetical protein